MLNHMDRWIWSLFESYQHFTEISNRKKTINDLKVKCESSFRSSVIPKNWMATVRSAGPGSGAGSGVKRLFSSPTLPENKSFCVWQKIIPGPGKSVVQYPADLHSEESQRQPLFRTVKFYTYWPQNRCNIIIICEKERAYLRLPVGQQV